MKILAIISNNDDYSQESYGYDIWKTMKEHFHMYLDDNDVGNIYHHLNDLCSLNYLNREDSVDGKCLYNMTYDGQALRERFSKYIEILNKSKTSIYRDDSIL